MPMYISEKDQYLPTDLLSNYREYLKTSGYSTPTVKNYLTDLRHLIVWINQNIGEFKFTTINEQNLRSYRAYLKEKFRSKPSISARRLSSLRKFLSWATDKSLITKDIVKAVSPILEHYEKEQVTPTPIQLVSPVAPSIPAQQHPIDLSSKKLHQKVVHHIKHTRCFS